MLFYNNYLAYNYLQNNYLYQRQHCFERLYKELYFSHLHLQNTTSKFSPPRWRVLASGGRGVSVCSPAKPQLFYKKDYRWFLYNFQNISILSSFVEDYIFILNQIF